MGNFKFTVSGTDSKEQTVPNTPNPANPQVEAHQLADKFCRELRQAGYTIVTADYESDVAQKDKVKFDLTQPQGLKRAEAEANQLRAHMNSESRNERRSSRAEQTERSANAPAQEMDFTKLTKDQRGQMADNAKLTDQQWQNVLAHVPADERDDLVQRRVKAQRAQEKSAR